MTRNLAGKVAIITGAATGIGAQSARVLAEHGASVIVADIDAPGAEHAAAAMREDGLAATAMALDVTVEAEIIAFVREVQKQHGRIDIIHNNAAIQNAKQRAADLDVVNLEAHAWDAAMAVNARGPMLLCKHALPVMMENGGGSIIHSSSGFGLLGEATLTAYGASKAALMNLSRFIATQYGKRGIRSNVIAIGFVLTQNALDSTPQAVKDVLLSHTLNPALGTPRNIADVVAFLAGHESIYINGALIPVDGGFTAHQPSMVHFQELFAAAGSNQL